MKFDHSLPGTIVVLSDIHWDFSWQVHHELSNLFAEKGYKVVFVEPLPLRMWPGWSRGFRYVRARLFGRPQLIAENPQPRNRDIDYVWPTGVPDVPRLGTWINRRILMPILAKRLRTKEMDRPIILLNFLPVSYSCAVQNLLGADVGIYACTNDFNNMPAYHRVPIVEDEMLNISDIVFATSPSLYYRLTKAHPKVIRLHTAVNYELFAPARRNTQNAQRLCVYFGTLSREHNDYDLLRKVSQQFALRLIGLIKDPINGFSPNTQVVGPVSIDELPAKLSDADVVLLPYKTSRHIESVIPAKTFQCLATGKPIISIGLTKMDWLSEVIYFCKNHEEFLKAIDATRDESHSLREARLAVAQANSWESRIDELEEVIREVLLEKGIAT